MDQLHGMTATAVLWPLQWENPNFRTKNDAIQRKGIPIWKTPTSKEINYNNLLIYETQSHRFVHSHIRSYHSSRPSKYYWREYRPLVEIGKRGSRSRGEDWRHFPGTSRWQLAFNTRSPLGMVCSGIIYWYKKLIAVPILLFSNDSFTNSFARIYCYRPSSVLACC